MADSLRIKGSISEKNYLKVISGDDLIGHQRLSRLNKLPTPVKVTLSEIASNGEKYESLLITLDNLTIANDGDIYFHEAKTYQTTDSSDKTNTVVIRIGNGADTYMDRLCLSSENR